MDEHGTGDSALPGGTPLPYGATPPYGVPQQPYGVPQPPYGTPAQPYGAPQSYGTPTMPEVLDSTSPGWSVLPGQDGAAPAGSGRGRPTAVVAAVVVGALLVSGGAFAAWSRLNQGAGQPADVLPASTVAVAEVDLDPSAAQKVAIFNLLRKFPDAAGLKGTDTSFGDWLVRKLSESGSGSDQLDFATDVQPWLGSKVAFAAVPAPSGQRTDGSPVDPVVVIQEKDDAAAAAAMEKLRAHGSADLGYALHGGYLVVTPSSRAAASRVVADAQSASLGADAHFTADVDSLGAEEVVTAWADAGRLSGLLQQQMQSSLGGVSGLGGGLGGPFDSLKGRWALGVHATNDSVELRMRTFGGTPTSAGAPVRLQHVAADPVAVLAVSGFGANLEKQWSSLAASPMYEQLLQEAKAVGLDLPGDLRKLLGDQLTASLSGRSGDQPQWVVAATSGDPAAGKAVLDKLLALAGPDAGDLPVSTRVDGDTLYVGSSASTLDGAVTTDAADALRNDELFRAAMADPDHAQTLVYVDLSKVWALMAGEGGEQPPAELQHLKAVGMTVTSSGSDSDSTVRVIIR
jgi:hypothetical protein